MLGSLMLYLKGMRRMIFQLSGFYYRVPLKGSLKGFYKGSIIGFYKDPFKGTLQFLASTIQGFGFEGSGLGPPRILVF